MGWCISGSHHTIIQGGIVNPAAEEQADPSKLNMHVIEIF